MASLYVVIFSYETQQDFLYSRQATDIWDNRRNGNLLTIILPIKYRSSVINPLNAELNPISHLPALLGAHLIFHVSRIRVNFCIRPSSFYG